MKKFTPYHYFVSIIILLWLVLLSSCNDNTIKLPSLRETYAPTDKKPFGGYVARRLSEQLFSSNTIREKTQSFSDTWYDIMYDDSSSVYICIAPRLFVTEVEIKNILNFVEAGNHLFIASNSIDDDLLSEIKAGQTDNYWQDMMGLDSFANTKTYTNLPASNLYPYYYKPFQNAFTSYDTAYTKVLGNNDLGKPNFIVYFHGKGKLFLHCDARAFSNYFLLKNDNNKFLEKAFAYTYSRPSHVYWDDYYRKLSGKNDGDSSSSAFSEILKHPPLALAFWLCLGLLGLYILFGGKRKQRIIPTIKPNENTTVAFTETIGRLYLQNKDNKNIADKMITYFNEHVRNNFYVNTNNINDDFISTLSRKSDIEQNKIETLYRTIQHAQQQPVINDFELLSLNTQIQQFYKKTNK